MTKDRICIGGNNIVFNLFIESFCSISIYFRQIGIQHHLDAPDDIDFRYQILLGQYCQRFFFHNTLLCSGYKDSTFYAEGREYNYRVTIQRCIERYIEVLTEKRISNLTIRLYKLEKEEAVKLLTELLKAGVKRVYDQDRYSKEWHTYGSVDSKSLDGEGVFAAIEQKHQETYSGETIEEERRRVNRWRFESLW